MISRGTPSVEYRELIRVIPETRILFRYLGISEIPCVTHSPLRNDRRPSFGLYVSRNGRICFRDLSTGDRGGLADLLCLMWNTSFTGVIDKIVRDFKDCSFTGDCIVRDSVSQGGCRKIKSNIGVVEREWRDYDIEYWKSFGISIEWLKFADVHPISHKIVYKNGEKYVLGAEKYAYVYVERKDGIVTYKIYQPFSKTYKWSSNTDSSVWSLWTRLPEKGRIVVISSSLKDSLNIWANLGIPSVCMQGEGYLPKKSVIDELKSRFRRVVVFYDNDFGNPDNPGRKDAETICRTYDLYNVEIPSEYGAKDPSDLFKKYGREDYVRIMKDVFTKMTRYGENKECESEVLQRDPF